jgi:hypothetical protein
MVYTPTNTPTPSLTCILYTSITPNISDTPTPSLTSYTPTPSLTRPKGPTQWMDAIKLSARQWAAVWSLKARPVQLPGRRAHLPALC